MHPLVSDLDKLSEDEIEKKIHFLTEKYFTVYNTDVQAQIVMVLDAYREELSIRRTASMEKFAKTHSSLDSLVKIS